MVWEMSSTIFVKMNPMKHIRPRSKRNHQEVEIMRAIPPKIPSVAIRTCITIPRTSVT